MVGAERIILEAVPVGVNARHPRICSCGADLAARLRRGAAAATTAAALARVATLSVREELHRFAPITPRRIPLVAGTAFDEHACAEEQAWRATIDARHAALAPGAQREALARVALSTVATAAVGELRRVADLDLDRMREGGEDEYAGREDELAFRLKGGRHRSRRCGRIGGAFVLGVARRRRSCRRCRDGAVATALEEH